MKIRQLLCLLPLFCFVLSGCNTFWEKDNTPEPTPLTPFKATLKPKQLWEARINFGFGHEDLKFSPVLDRDELFVLNQSGTLSCLNRNNGKLLWTTTVNTRVSSNLAVDEQMLVIGSKDGDVLALNRFNRNLLWKAEVDSEILATPVISANLVIIKSINGRITAFSKADGHLVWRHQENEPSLILRGASRPQLVPSAVLVGYASGRIEKLALKDGHEFWSRTIATPEGAFAIQRMIDIDADPVLDDTKVFAATFQGKLAALNLSNGEINWDRDLSVYSGIAADKTRVYAADVKGNLWAFDQRNGQMLWKQNKLENRILTGPVLAGGYLVVGDEGGVLHWLNLTDGHFAGRVQVSGAALLTKPVASSAVVYVIAKDGYLTAYVVN